MAEFVESRMEEMVSVFEKIKQTNLVKEKKLKKLIGETREHELKIQRPARTLEDFFNYFTFLKHVLEILQAKREKLGYFHHTIEIEDRLKAIITSRFGMANHNFKHELRFWTFRLHFMREMNWLEHVSNLFTEVTKVLGSKYPQLWIDASNFEWSKQPETSKGIETARQFVQMGLRRHSTVPSLYIQGFYLELKFVEFILQNPTEKEKVLELENGKKILDNFILAKSFYKQAKKICHQEGSKLYQAFYEVSKTFPFAKRLCSQILEEMQLECFSEESTFDILAKIALAEGKGKIYQAQIDNCIKCYEDGLTARPTVKMYDLYIATLSYLTNEINAKNKYDIEIKLLQLFERAYENWKLSEQNYIKWFQLVKSIEEDDVREYKPSSNLSSGDILEISYSKFPNNSQILHEKICQEIFKSEDAGVQDSSMESYLKQLKKSQGDTTSIWLGLFINATLQPKVKPEDCEKLIRQAPRPVQGRLAILFIKYFGCTDMEIARTFYDQNFTNPNISMEFHIEMAKLEATTLSDNQNSQTILARVNQCYGNCSNYFGENSIQPWIAHLKFERQRRDIGSSATSTIYSRALMQLSPHLKEEFILAEQQLGRKN